MAALFDIVTPQTGTNADFTHTPVGTPTLISVSANWFGNADVTTNLTAMTYGGNAMTRKVYIDNNGNTTPGASAIHVAEIFTLENPPSGAQTVSITVTGTAPRAETYHAVSYTGTPTSAATGTAKTASDNANDKTSASITGVVSETDGLVLDTLTTQEDENHTEDSGQTPRWDLGDAGTSFRGAGSTEPGAASVDMGWTWTTGTRFAYVALPILPADAQKPAQPKLIGNQAINRASLY